MVSWQQLVVTAPWGFGNLKGRKTVKVSQSNRQGKQRDKKRISQRISQRISRRISERISKRVSERIIYDLKVYVSYSYCLCNTHYCYIWILGGEKYPCILTVDISSTCWCIQLCFCQWRTSTSNLWILSLLPHQQQPPLQMVPVCSSRATWKPTHRTLG